MHFVRAWVTVSIIAISAEVSAADDWAGSKDAATSARDARAVAARIDAVLSVRWAEAKFRPTPLADDGEFLRRVSLDLIGKIPTASEASDFLDDPRSDKRLSLVERLLDSPAYTTRATELWRGLLLPEAETEDQARQFAGNFEAWLRRKVTEEAGYDRIVRDLLTAKLSNPNSAMINGRGEPSASAYYLAKENKPENLAAGVSRVFLGVRLECAQCHDHPFARWKREQFWGFAAFFAGLQAQQADTAAAIRPTPNSTPRRELTIPGTKKVIQAGHLDGSLPAWRPRADSREVLADWITAPSNPDFARAVVNRVWARFFGVGLIEPIDDLGVESAPEFAPLLDELARQFRLHGYDLKFLIRVITATKAYNLTSAGDPLDVSSAPFATMPVRGLSAGQLFDSLVQATGMEGGRARSRFLDLFASREERPTEAHTSILQALTLMNGSYVAAATNPETGDALGAIANAPFLDTAGRIETLYLATLTRRPKPDEKALLVNFIEHKKTPEELAKGLADVLWAIINGPEFYLNH